MYFSEQGHVIRRYLVNGTVIRIAGTSGSFGSIGEAHVRARTCYDGDANPCICMRHTPGDGGPALTAKLYSPSGMAIDSLGGIYVAGMRSRVGHGIAL